MLVGGQGRRQSRRSRLPSPISAKTVRRLPHDLPRKAQRLTAAALAILLALAGSCSAIAAERGRDHTRRLPRRRCRMRPMPHRPRARRAALMPAAGHVETRFGTIVTPNITPDRETGIGAMERRRLHSRRCVGASPRMTSHYLPTFPVPLLQSSHVARSRRSQGVSRQRAGRVAARTAPASRAPFASARAAVAVLASPFPGTMAARSDAETRCGTAAPISLPRSVAAAIAIPRATGSGAPDPRRLSPAAADGGGGQAAPNITPDPETGIGRWSESDIVNLLTDGQKPDFDFVGGAMGEIVEQYRPARRCGQAGDRRLSQIVAADSIAKERLSDGGRFDTRR